MYSTQSKSLKSIRAYKDIFLYVCGVTPYDIMHMGHAYLFSHFDVLVRYLSFLHYTVTYVQNITDIDDCISTYCIQNKLNQSKLIEANCRELKHFFSTMNFLLPTHMPRTSQHIPQIVKKIEVLLSQKKAYKVNGYVYYDSTVGAPFGCISHLKKEEWENRLNKLDLNPPDINKQALMDFVLWKPSKSNEPSYPASFGSGRPGWHIQCAALSTHYLEQPFTIHGGGEDLAFPHHDAEALITHERGDLSDIWMHVGNVYHKGKKMSKSLGNTIFISDLLKEYTSNIIRIFLLEHHYQSSWSFVQENLSNAEKIDHTFQQALKISSKNKRGTLDSSQFYKNYQVAMENNLNIPTALKISLRLSKAILNSQDRSVNQAQYDLRQMLTIMGLLYE